MLVAGVDSSTQSTKVILCEAGDGTIVARASAQHPGGTECPPQAWQDALTKAGGGLLSRAAAVGVAGQQHGMVVLDSGAEVIRPALLWNDLRSAAAAAELVAERGPGWWAERTGSVPNASFTVTKLRWLAEHEPDHAARVFRVMLPHDWLTWALLAGPPAGQEPVTDRGDASGTGYFSPADGAWLREVAVSVGTSGTAYAVTTVAAADPSGAIAGFADATGRFLPLVCTINAALVLDSVAALLGTDAAGLSARAMAAGPGAGGITLLPYFDGERTPVRPGATGALHGLTTRNATPENLARAAVEAVLASLADVAGLLLNHDGARPDRTLLSSVILIGGGARSEAVRAAAPGIFGCPVDVPEPEEYVALGAARQAAWALAGTPDPPAWPRRPAQRYEGPDQPGIRERFTALRDATTGLDGGLPARIDS